MIGYIGSLFYSCISSFFKYYNFVYEQEVKENPDDNRGANEANPRSLGQEDKIRIPLVQQVLSLDLDEINKDMGTCTETIDKIKLWGQKKKRVIQDLKEAASYLTTLQKISSRSVGMVGTSVSVVSALSVTGAAVGAGALVMFSATAPVPMLSYGTGTFSTGSVLLKNYSTEQRKKKLKRDLERAAKDMIELKTLMSNFAGALERLSKIDPILKYFFKFGGATEVCEELCSGMRTENITNKKIVKIVDRIYSNKDKFRTYMTTFVMSTASVGQNSTLGKIDWGRFIKSSAEIVSGLEKITLEERTIEAAVNETECISLAVSGMSSLTLVLNLAAIFVDACHLVDLVCLDKKPEIIKEARELAEFLQQKVDDMESKYPKQLY